MTADQSGKQEPEEEQFKFSPGQGVLITFFGRVTPMVFDFLQVEKFDRFFT